MVLLYCQVSLKLPVGELWKESVNFLKGNASLGVGDMNHESLALSKSLRLDEPLFSTVPSLTWNDENQCRCYD